MTDNSKNKGYLSILDVNGDGNVDIDDFLSLFRSSPQSKARPPALAARTTKIWANSTKDLENLSGAIRAKVESGRPLSKKSWISLADRKMSGILKRLELNLVDKNLEELRSDYLDCTDNIKKTEEEISDLISASSLADIDKRQKIENSIEKEKNRLVSFRSKRSDLLTEFVDSFTVYNVNISTEQAEVLLSRIDSGDVTRMMSVFAVISQLTKQFSDAKQASGENTATAQKYYAMYIGLLELQEIIQSTYIERMDKEYLPGISKVLSAAEKLTAETQVLMKTMPIDHIRSYEQNMQSQEFTIKVATIYENALREDRARAIQAREIVRNLLRLAENTLKTVKVASDLVSLMKDSQGLYDEVMQLQTPSLVPFENLELMREFQAVTEKLKTEI